MALIDRQLSDCCSGFAQFWAAVLRVPALRESPRTPLEPCLPKKTAGQPEAARDLVVESPNRRAARITRSKEKYRPWQRRPEAIQFLIKKAWRVV